MLVMQKNTQRGFTLIEVMIALFIVAVALGGAIKAMGNAVNTSSALADKTFAQWVGLNQFARLKLSGKWPKPGEQTGDEDMAHREWKWVQKISTTEDDNVNRVEIFVSDSRAEDDEGASAKIIGFLARPSATSTRVPQTNRSNAGTPNNGNTPQDNANNNNAVN